MDPVRQRLQQAALEEQSPLEFLHETFGRVPLFLPFAGFCSGLAAARVLELSWRISAVLTVCCLAGYLLWHQTARGRNRQVLHQPRSTAAGCLLLFVIFFSLGTVRLAWFTRPKPNDIRGCFQSDSALATIRAKMLTPVHPSRQGDWAFARYSYHSSGGTAYIRLTHILTKSGTFRPVSGRLFMRIRGPAKDLAPGNSFEAFCRLEKPAPAGNPGQFDFKQYLADKGIYYIASVESMEAVTHIYPIRRFSIPWVRRFLQHFTHNLLDSSTLANPDEKGLLEALLLGTRRNISDQTMQAFRKTGLAHFISLSGLHLGLLFGFCWCCSRLAGLAKRPRAVLCAVVILAYIFILPPRAPTLRAAVICLFYCTSILLVKRPNALNTLCLAGLGILLFRPTDLFSAGFQLSFSTVLGILLLYPAVHSSLLRPVNWIQSHLPNSGPAVLLQNLLRGFFELIGVGLSAWLGGLGILLVHFQAVTPLAALWTVLTFPLVTVVLIAGALKILVTHLLPTVGMLLSWIAARSSSLLIALVSGFENIPLNYILVGSVPLLFAAIYYLLLAFSQVPLLRPRNRIALVGILTVFTVFSLTGFHRYGMCPPGLEITVFDVGKGQCILVNHRGRDRLLFDAGSTSFSDPGRKVILPCLQYRGISRLDAVFLSHDDIDHINAAPELAEELTVAAVYLNPSFLTKAEDSPRVQMLIDRMAGKNIPIEPEINYTAHGPLSVTPLWPNEATCDNPLIPDNDKSQVFLLEYAGRKILITGDIERPAQMALLQSCPDLTVDVLVMPHHGSTVNRLPDFHERLEAEILLVSCDRTQYRNTAIKKSGDAEIFYTAVDGCIKITISPEGVIKSSTFRD